MGGEGQLLAQRQSQGRIASHFTGAHHDPAELLEAQGRFRVIDLILAQPHLRKQPPSIHANLGDQFHQIAHIVDGDRGTTSTRVQLYKALMIHGSTIR